MRHRTPHVKTPVVYGMAGWQGHGTALTVDIKNGMFSGGHYGEVLE